MTDGVSKGMWFERLFVRAKLPFWAGVILVGMVPLAFLLPASYYAAGLWSDFPKASFLFPYIESVTIFMMYATRHMRRRLEKIAAYADSLMADGSRSNLEALYRWKGVVATYIVFMTIIQVFYLLFQFPKNYTFLQGMTVSAAFFYWNAFVNTFVWVFLYSMLRMYRIGKLQLKLIPFTEDRTLGLRPFGRFSLQVTALYLLLVLVIVVPQIAFGLGSESLAIFGLILMLSGIVVFLVPLLGLHRRLTLEKQKYLAWIAPQYTELVRRLNEKGVQNADERVFSELSGIDKLQRDIHQIHGWPFDVGIITRLAAILFSMIAILFSGYIRTLFHF